MSRGEEVSRRGFLLTGAVAERLTTGAEEPYQDWVAAQGRVEGQEYTVALVNDSTYSYDRKGGVLRTVLVRAAPFARHDPHQVSHNDAGAWQDQGRQERRFCSSAGAVITPRSNSTDFTVESGALNVKHRAQLKPWEMKTLLLERARAGSQHARTIKLNMDGRDEQDEAFEISNLEAEI